MARVLSRHVIHEGRDHGLAVAEISADGLQATVTPYAGETHSTRYTDLPVRIVRGDDGKFTIVAEKFGQSKNIHYLCTAKTIY